MPVFLNCKYTRGFWLANRCIFHATIKGPWFAINYLSASTHFKPEHSKIILKNLFFGQSTYCECIFLFKFKSAPEVLQWCSALPSTTSIPNLYIMQLWLLQGLNTQSSTFKPIKHILQQKPEQLKSTKIINKTVFLQEQAKYLDLFMHPFRILHFYIAAKYCCWSQGILLGKLSITKQSVGYQGRDFLIISWGCIYL